MNLRSSKMEEKLALSYAMAQSSKLFVFELKVLQSLEKTRFLPKELAMKGLFMDILLLYLQYCIIIINYINIIDYTIVYCNSYYTINFNLILSFYLYVCIYLYICIYIYISICRTNKVQ